MRRFIAVFSLSIFIIIHFLSFKPVSAISSVDYGEMLNIYLGAAETALAASQGVTIDWSNMDLPAGSDTWTDKQKAQYIVNYIGALKKVGQHAIYDWLFGEGNDTQDIISAETSAIGLSNNSNLNTLDIKAQLDNILATQSQDHIFQRYSDKVIARWNEYNTNYINDYLDQMDTTDSITYPEDPNRISLCSISSPNQSSISFTCLGYDENGFSFDYHGTTYNNLHYPFLVEYDDGDPSWDYFYVVGKDLIPNDGYGYPPNPNAYWYPMQGGIANATINTNYPIFFNITDAITYSQSGSVISGGNIGFTLPDAVIDSGTDDGKIVAHPIYYPDTMNTDKAIDIDLDKVIDAIASRIAQGDTDITFDDLIDAGAAVKLDGTTLSDADTVVKDVSVPIARARVDTINGVIPTIDVIPPLPPLPPINPGDYSGEGFSGMSVLARIVNATVQSLPAPVILTFFGVVFGAVILGIIKILHH